jgi:hypothetical protein
LQGSAIIHLAGRKKDKRFYGEEARKTQRRKPHGRTLRQRAHASANYALFVETVSDNPHLTIADAPFLATYVQALAKTYTRTKNRCSKRKGVGDDSARDDFDDVKLRPTSHSQTHPEKAGRARNNATPPSYYDLQQEHSDD